MSLHCFFGLELRADGVSVTPPMPPNTSLVLTHCALTSTLPGTLTLYVQSHEQPNRFALCTLSAERSIFYAPLQLIFAQKVSFTLVEWHANTTKTTGSTTSADSERYPTVHLTGYYESEEEAQQDAAEFDDSNDDDDGDMENTEDVGAAGRKRARSDTKKEKQRQQQEQQGKKKKNKNKK
ncbi:Nucleoplasmin-like domain [Trypanosoma melophagium]|uniref:Nucleoplasmin-like domain n=1 Tax=Trypanosoma melophagium TaxID=715481 RepID=UPI00351A29C2|nr:Nucleoplasmin-like domain [Trypanosoma melophagium]